MTESAFSKGNPSLRRVWDSTTFRAFLKDPASYKLKYVEGWRGIDPAPPLVFGQYMHAALELYDKERFKHGDSQIALEAALDYAHALATSRTEYGYTLDEIAENFAKKTQRNHRTLKTLLRTIVWYEANYGQDDPVQVLGLGGEPAVELSWRIPLPIKTPYGEDYIMAGHLDGLVDLGGNRFVRERKHTARTVGSYYFDQFSPDPQISTYALLGSAILGEPVQGVLVEVAQVGVNFSRFERREIPRTKGQQDEFIRDLCFWIKTAERMAEEGHWPMNDVGLQIFGGGEWRQLLARDPAHREAYIGMNFKKDREGMWNPLEER